MLTHMQTWRRPTLPRLKTKYHRRWGVSRPSSEWDRVQPPRHYHQVGVCVNMISGPATWLCQARRFVISNPRHARRASGAKGARPRWAARAEQPSRLRDEQLRER